jgi:23S rRNA (uridine2552-2'-O)-methyltransferase
MANYGKPDFWALKAQKEGYPARSVYKLRELDENFALLPRAGNSLGRGHSGGPGTSAEPHKGRRFLFSGFRVLDLGAAPGSWSLYVLRTLAGNCFLVASDLSSLSRQYDRGLFDGDNFLFMQGDITSVETRDALLARGPYDLLLSDAAPATTGSRQVDTLRSLALVEAALDYAETALAKGGNLAVKVFQGGDTASLLKRIRELFKSGKSFKPKVCRRESFETYYVGLDKK